MEQDKTLIESLYEAFGKGDIPTVIASLAPDVSWFTEGPSVVPYTGPRERHRSGVRDVPSHERR